MFLQVAHENIKSEQMTGNVARANVVKWTQIRILERDSSIEPFIQGARRTLGLEIASGDTGRRGRSQRVRGLWRSLKDLS